MITNFTTEELELLLHVTDFYITDEVSNNPKQLKKLFALKDELQYYLEAERK